MLKIKLKVFFLISSLFLITGNFAQGQQTLFNLMPPSTTHVEFINALTESPELNIITYQYFYNGAGVGIGDLNNDGLADIYLCSNMTGDKLYLNKGNFEFEDVSVKAGISEISGWSTGVCFADVNADGLLDMYICKSGLQPVDLRRNKLFINKGDMKFVDEAAKFGIDDPSFSTQASFFDYDNDGDLDMFLLNHEIVLQKNFHVSEIRTQRSKYGGNKLYRNDNGFYNDVSEAAGINGSPINFGLGIVAGDFNNDGWIDVFVTNDYQERDFLYINKQDGTFSEELTTSFNVTSQFSMGTDLADINNDGWPDLFVADMLPADNFRQKLLKGPSKYDAYQISVDNGLFHQSMRNTLQLNNQDGTFSEIGQYANVYATDWSWAPLFADFDNDGYKDLFISNGYRRDFTNMDFIRYTYADEERKAGGQGKNINYYEVIQKMPSVKLANYVFSGNQTLQFENKTMDWGLTKPSFSNGSAYGDLDNDGDLDLVINNIDDTVFIYRNNAKEIYHRDYVQVKIIGSGKNTFGIGTKITVQAGDKIYSSFVMPVRGYESSMDYIATIGVGEAKMVDVIVEFPGGEKGIFKNWKTSTRLVVDQSKLTPYEYGDGEYFKKLFVDQTSKNILMHYDTEENYIDFKRETLLPHGLSSPGPMMAVGDLNGDHFDDVFIGGSKNKKAKCFFQDENGNFYPLVNAPWNADSAYEDTGILIFDADGDSDNDIYVASGGNEYEINSAFYQDRIYINDGAGNFSKNTGALPLEYFSKSCVRSADFDRDGDLDLFVGGKLIPGKYPLSPQSFLFENISSNGEVKFIDATSKCPGLLNAGMVNDAQWADVNDDNRPDLIIAGEWMPVTLFINSKSGFTESKKIAPPGWWNCIVSADVDNDGDMDIIAGNRGTNNQVKASEKYPVEIYADDYDGNGSIDALLFNYLQSTHEPGAALKSFPVASRDDLLDQMNGLKKKYVYYGDYADATHDSIFQYTDVSGEMHLITETFESICLINNGKGNFGPLVLPFEAQFFEANCIVAKDFNRDGNIDLLIAGNDSAMRPELGRMDAGYGLFLKGNGDGTFTVIPNYYSGISIPGDAKCMKPIKIQGDNYVVITRNKMQTVLLMVNE